MALWCYRARLTGGCLTLPFEGCKSELGPSTSGGDMVLAVESDSKPDMSGVKGVEVLGALDPSLLSSRPNVPFTIITWGS